MDKLCGQNWERVPQVPHISRWSHCIVTSLISLNMISQHSVLLTPHCDVLLPVNMHSKDKQTVKNGQAPLILAFTKNRNKKEDKTFPRRDDSDSCLTYKQYRGTLLYLSTPLSAWDKKYKVTLIGKLGQFVGSRWNHTDNGYWKLKLSDLSLIVDTWLCIVRWGLGGNNVSIAPSTASTGRANLSEWSLVFWIISSGTCLASWRSESRMDVRNLF